MDTKRLYVDFHVLQTVPPSCVNRDDTGSPKTAVYGGAVRARVSSQAWKHAMRVMFTEEMSDAVETGYRTKKGTDLVAEQIKSKPLLRTRMPSNWPRRSLQMQASRAMTRAQKRCFS